MKWGDAGSFVEGGVGVVVFVWSRFFRGEWVARAFSDGFEDTFVIVFYRVRVFRADGRLGEK